MSSLATELSTGARGPLLLVGGLGRPQPRLGFGNRLLALALGLLLTLCLFGGTLRGFGGAPGLLGGGLGGDSILPRLLFSSRLGALLLLGGLAPIRLRLLRRGLCCRLLRRRSR